MYHAVHSLPTFVYAYMLHLLQRKHLRSVTIGADSIMYHEVNLMHDPRKKFSGIILIDRQLSIVDTSSFREQHNSCTVSCNFRTDIRNRRLTWLGNRSPTHVFAPNVSYNKTDKRFLYNTDRFER